MRGWDVIVEETGCRRGTLRTTTAPHLIAPYLAVCRALYTRGRIKSPVPFQDAGAAFWRRAFSVSSVERAQAA